MDKNKEGEEVISIKAILNILSIGRHFNKKGGFVDWLFSMVALFAGLYEIGKELGMTTIDISNLNVSSEFLPMMLIIAIPVVTFFGYLISMQSYNDVLKSKGKTKEELPYDNKYMMASIASIILGIAGGICLAPIALDYLGIIGAGSLVMGFVAAVIGTVIMWILIRVTHCGIDVLITDVQKLNTQVSTATTEVSKLADTVTDAKDTLVKK